MWTECTCNVRCVYFICECGQSVLVMWGLYILYVSSCQCGQSVLVMWGLYILYVSVDRVYL